MGACANISNKSPMWWLILCVSLTGLCDAQIGGKTLFLDVSVIVSPGEISIWIRKLSKEDHPHQCGWASSNLLRTWIENKSRGKASLLSYCLGWKIHLLPSHIDASRFWAFILRLGFTLLALLVLRPKDLDWNYTANFPGSLVCR